MENIKFVKQIMGNKNEYYDLGNCRYYPLKNGNTAKVFVAGGNIYNKTYGVTCEIVNEKNGIVDKCYFPFENYFKPTRCSANSPLWYQHIDMGVWYFSKTYTHVLPTQEDFNKISDAIFAYMRLFS